MSGFTGKVIFLGVNGNKVQCETNSKLNIEMSRTQIQRCKGASRFANSVPGRGSWSVEVDANALLESVATTQLTILEEMMDEGSVEIVFQSDPLYYTNDEKFAIVGNAVISNFSWETPSDDASTWTATFTGNGPFTITREENIIYAWSQDGLNAVINGRARRMIYVYGAEFN